MLQGFRTQADVQQEAEEAAREELMGGTGGGGAAGGAAGGEPQIHQTLPDSIRCYCVLPTSLTDAVVCAGVGGAMAAAGAARDQIRDNLEQLGDMADQTEELHENASSFAALATQARRKQEASVSGKVGKLFGI